MNLVLDACSAINLVNGRVLEQVSRLASVHLHIGPLSLGECKTVRCHMEPIIDGGGISLVDDSNIPAAKFLRLCEEYGLGDGETEALTVALLFGFGVCTDDAQARRAAAAEIGSQNVTGSIGLLRQLITHEVMTPQQAHAAYRSMVDRGAFLPQVAPDYFSDPLTKPPAS